MSERNDMTTEPEALRLADRMTAKANAMRSLGEELEKVARDSRRTMRDRQADQLEEAAAELRRLHAENAALIHDIGEYVKAASDLAAQSLADEALLREAENVICNLRALILGECPSLLNEDSGGSSSLDMDAIDALSRLRERLKG